MGAKKIIGKRTEAKRKATFYVNESLHKALRVKAAEADRSPSEYLNEVLVNLFQEYLEDLEDIAAIRARKKEKGKGITLQALKKKLKLDV